MPSGAAMPQNTSVNDVTGGFSTSSYDPSFDDAEGDDLDALDDCAVESASTGSVGQASALSGVVPGVRGVHVLWAG